MNSARTLPGGLVAALNGGLLACPLCSQPLRADGRSLRCERNHCFDVARQGHVNLAPGKSAGGEEHAYGRPLMEARARVIAAGFFSTLSARCAELLRGLPGPLHLLDAGCGEGSFLSEVAGRLRTLGECVGLGIDLSGDGIRMAAGRFKQDAWCVADLARVPCPAGSVSAVLNVLSPANYGEFRRVLRPGGLLVKAVPTVAHLQEIRTLLPSAGEFSNERVVDHFRSFFPGLETGLVETRLSCTPENAADFLAMTPLGWRIEDAVRARFLAEPPREITVSFELLHAFRP